VNLREAVGFLCGAHDGLLHHVPHTRGSRRVDGIQLELGLIQGVGSQEEQSVAAGKRCAKRRRMVVVDRDGLDATRAGDLCGSL